MTEEEKKLFRLYGKLPTHKNVLTKVQKDRKYFDSGDYALSKAGVAPPSNVGTAIPSPENIPHASPPTPLSTSTSGTPAATPGIPIAGAHGHGSSPVRESPLASATSSPLVTENLAEASSSSPSSSEIPPSSSPTSSYPIFTAEGAHHHHSPLNPASSGSATITADDNAESTKDDQTTNPPSSIDLSKVVPGVNKSELPNAATPMSGEEADTEMA
ncbi:hypothetical protein PIIN_06930 [Serendipita indica DSM 11827]|uniref:mRNA stability protein n=1 Tax=Serendipita indica (strain DSM 11827) TaxID=1109443 RepID=G4TNT2_SERID|nr:hypothetical protein PIIN_06930 [Serendipita indica DSM 11827]